MRGKTKSLRGPKLTARTIQELNRLDSWQNGTPLTWANLAFRVGVSRQALERKPEIVAAYQGTQERLKTAAPIVAAKEERNSAEDRIKALETENRQLQQKLDAWLEKWFEMERNCHEMNMDPQRVIGALSGVSANDGLPSSGPACMQGR